MAGYIIISVCGLTYVSMYVHVTYVGYNAASIFEKLTSLSKEEHNFSLNSDRTRNSEIQESQL